MESGIKRTQRDYTLAFKLAVVEQVEKGELTYKQAQQPTVSRVDRRYWCGCASTVAKAGAVRHHVRLCPETKRQHC